MFSPSSFCIAVVVTLLLLASTYLSPPQELLLATPPTYSPRNSIFTPPAIVQSMWGQQIPQSCGIHDYSQYHNVSCYILSFYDRYELDIVAVFVPLILYLLNCTHKIHASVNFIPPYVRYDYFIYKYIYICFIVIYL